MGPRSHPGRTLRRDRSRRFRYEPYLELPQVPSPGPPPLAGDASFESKESVRVTHPTLVSRTRYRERGLLPPSSISNHTLAKLA